jgi:hypothetical protein
MSRTHQERILDYLWSISADHATNRQIREATGVVPQATKVWACLMSVSKMGADELADPDGQRYKGGDRSW